VLFKFGNQVWLREASGAIGTFGFDRKAHGNLRSFGAMTAKIPNLSPCDEMEVAKADSLFSENQVLALRPCLARGLLLAARKAGIITWTPGKRHSAWYRLADVDAFLKTREQQCHALGHAPSSNSADNGSPKNPVGPGSTVSGMTPALAEHAGRASAHRILGKQNSA
jgi:hypothetical protein